MLANLAAECQRIELGTFTVNSTLNGKSCGGEFQEARVHWDVRNRRFYIADPECGVVFAVGNFMTPPQFPNNNGSVVDPDKVISVTLP